ncbi:uncharacterized protein LOC115885110 [Sitophilus oryzae]|uniref:Uncharacterized protein LOC115885110 n=1 Tax=Sitophilus oryzae TaxID=7048 RepID=A0A6J2Y7F8_SITOR|nr:uncharacterized protein LOC115885110 [Sitophilus oryzae]
MVLLIAYSIALIYLYIKNQLVGSVVAMHFLMVLLITIIVPTSGQRSENQWHLYSEKLYSMPWYTWNTKNCNTLLLMMAKSKNDIIWSIINKTAINYDLLVGIWKIFYFFINALLKSKKFF